MIINYTEKQGNTGRKQYKKGVNADATGKKIKYFSTANRWDQHQIHRTSLKAEGRTRQVIMIWDTIEVPKDKSNDPQHKRATAERMALCSGENIVNSDKSGQATEVRRNPECALASQLIREESRARRDVLQETTMTQEEDHSPPWRKHKQRHAKVADAEWRRYKPRYNVQAPGRGEHTTCTRCTI